MDISRNSAWRSETEDSLNCSGEFAIGFLGRGQNDRHWELFRHSDGQQPECLSASRVLSNSFDVDKRLGRGVAIHLSRSRTGNAFLPQTPESYGYDPDGNLASDGRWTYTLDGENRLTSMQSLSSLPSGAKRKLDFTYDSTGRRIQKIMSTWSGSSYVPQSTNKFLYDGWNLLAELDGGKNLVRSYQWGLDLSGSIQGAVR